MMQPRRRGQQRPGGGAHAHGAVEVDVHRVGKGHGVVLGAAADDAGAVHHHVQRAQPATRACTAAPSRTSSTLRGRAGAARRGGHLGRGGAGDGDLVALRRKRRGNAGADAAGAAGDEHLAAGRWGACSCLQVNASGRHNTLDATASLG
jgi:hypothetical protein